MKLSRLLARKPAPHANSLRRRLETLEDRSVPAANFLSALGVGNDTGESRALDIAADAAGNSYVTGFFSGTTDFDPAHVHAGDADILTARGAGDAFVAKYAADGSLIWGRRMGGDEPDSPGYSHTDTGNKISVDGGGSVYVVGNIMGAADVGPVTLISAGDRDGFVAKLGPDGTIQWANRWGGATDDRGNGVGVDAVGNVYALGSTFVGSGGNGINVLKFGPTGAAAWTKWVNTKVDSGGDLAVSGAGDVFVTGTFRYTVDFDPGMKVRSFTSGPFMDAYVLKLTSAGSYVWAATFTGQGTAASAYGYSFGTSLALDGSGNVIVGGYYSGPVDFKPGTGIFTLPTGRGGYITKLNRSGAFVWAKALENFGGAGGLSVSVSGLAVDAAGSVYATGYFSGAADFDPGTGTASRTSNGGDDAFVVKLTSAGNFGWVETFGAAGADKGAGIAVDPSGTVYLAGSYQNTVDFDPDATGIYELTTPGTKSNLFFLKLTQP